jgi:hypothetical protein
MNNNYIYSVLQYKHSEFTGEALNVGVLLFWPKTKSIYFNYSKNLSRIKNLYSNFSEKIILEYLKIIENKCQKHNKSELLFYGNDLYFEFDNYINDNIFIKNSNSLQFSKPTKSINYFNDPEIVLNNLLENHFIKLDQKKEIKIHIETKLIKKYSENLIELGIENIENIENKFQKNKTITNETGNEFKFDFAWQNGSLNLVKPLNFDLNEQKYIAEKAYKNFGLFTDLENEAIENNYRYDLLLSKPQKKEFFKEYDHAIKLLEKLTTVKLVPEDDLSNYSEYTYRQLIKSKKHIL